MSLRIVVNKSCWCWWCLSWWAGFIDGCDDSVVLINVVDDGNEQELFLTMIQMNKWHQNCWALHKVWTTEPTDIVLGTPHKEPWVSLTPCGCWTHKRLIHDGGNHDEQVQLMIMENNQSCWCHWGLWWTRVVDVNDDCHDEQVLFVMIACHWLMLLMISMNQICVWWWLYLSRVAVGFLFFMMS